MPAALEMPVGDADIEPSAMPILGRQRRRYGAVGDADIGPSAMPMWSRRRCRYRAVGDADMEPSAMPVSSRSCERAVPVCPPPAFNNAPCASYRLYIGLYLGIADGMSIARVWACWYSKSPPLRAHTRAMPYIEPAFHHGPVRSCAYARRAMP